MTEHPIFMKAWEVRSILDDNKTQTRRIACKGTIPSGYVTSREYEPGRFRLFDAETAEICPNQYTLPPCPYGAPGDRLWVRETWQAFFEDEMPPDRPRGPRHTMGIPAQPERKSFVYYRAEGDAFHPATGARARWNSPQRLPRKYSRILLEATAVRVERLQAISRGDAMAEGCPFPNMAKGDDPRRWFAKTWIADQHSASWDANPWVWVIEFQKVKP